jgi:hypothetical protein
VCRDLGESAIEPGLDFSVSVLGVYDNHCSSEQPRLGGTIDCTGELRSAR